MIGITICAAVVLAAVSAWPELPISQAVTGAMIRTLHWLRSKASLGRVLIAISFTLLLFAAFWALQGDAPVALAMALPEVAAWFSTFEIATVVEALVGLGTAWLALRASGTGNILRGKANARRRRSQRGTADAPRGANDDDRPARWAIAA